LTTKINLHFVRKHSIPTSQRAQRFFIIKNKSVMLVWGKKLFIVTNETYKKAAWKEKFFLKFFLPLTTELRKSYKRV